MRARSKYVWATAATLVVAATSGLSLVSSVEYDSFSPWSPPVRLDYCGAHFYRHDAGPHVGMLGDGAIVTEAQALSIADSAKLDPRGDIGIFNQWHVYVPAGFQCPQDAQQQFDSWMFVSLGPDRYLELTDAN